MQNSISKYINWSKTLFTALVLATAGTHFVSAQAVAEKTAVGTSKTWGTVDGISVVGLVQGPSAAKADLQIACVFEYTEGDIFNPPALPKELNGMVHLDEALKGIITEVRKKDSSKATLWKPY